MSNPNPHPATASELGKLRESLGAFRIRARDLLNRTDQGDGEMQTVVFSVEQGVVNIDMQLRAIHGALVAREHEQKERKEWKKSHGGPSRTIELS